MKNCIDRMCLVTRGCAWVNGCRPPRGSRDFSVTKLSVTFSYLALGVGATTPRQLPNTKSEAINRRSTKSACEGIGL